MYLTALLLLDYTETAGSIWAAIWPNLAASVMWATPAFISHHILLKWHINKKNEELKKHLSKDT